MKRLLCCLLLAGTALAARKKPAPKPESPLDLLRGRRRSPRYG